MFRTTGGFVSQREPPARVSQSKGGSPGGGSQEPSTGFVGDAVDEGSALEQHAAAREVPHGTSGRESLWGHTLPDHRRLRSRLLRPQAIDQPPLSGPGGMLV